jgi:hypothetical protein
MTPALLHADGRAHNVLTPEDYVLDDTQSLAHASGTGALLEQVVDAESDMAWWLWSDLVLCPLRRVLVEVAVN